MGKRLFLLLAGILLLNSVSYGEKVLVKLIDDDGEESIIEYNQDGRIQRISGGGSADYLKIDVDWSKFGEGIVSMNFLTDDGPLPINITLDKEGRAIKVVDSLFGLNLYDLGYDSNGYLVSVKCDAGDLITERTLIWENGDLVKIAGTDIDDYGRSTFTTTVEYTDANHPSPVKNKGEVVGGLYSCMFNIDEAGLMSLFQLMGIVGKRVENLPVYALTQSSAYLPYDYKIDYILDSDGYPITGIETENNEITRDNFVWGDQQLSGITTIISGERKVIGYYDINGMKIEKPVKGLTIVRYSDGSYSKFVTKD